MDDSSLVASATKFKVCLLGDAAVGKTSLCKRFVHDTFKAHEQTTLMSACSERFVQIDKQTICLSLWDTAGSERFRSVVGIYYRGASAILLVYDVTNPNTLNNIYYWLGEVRKHARPDCLLVVAANKGDLCRDKSALKDGEKFAKICNAKLFRTSALTGENVEELFRFIGTQLLDSNRSNQLDFETKEEGIISLEASNPERNPNGKSCPC